MNATSLSLATQDQPRHFGKDGRSEKIKGIHLERLAMVYVRQSTPQQVLNHQESTRLQYSLRERALYLGWPEGRIVVIDDDLGKSAATAEGRTGFQRLVLEVGLGHVGIILGVEMSRLARSCKDWHQLLEVCALFGTLIADLDGIYDPIHYNDRLLLGLKGTMSEAELHILKQRMHQGRLHKASRGELFAHLPMGYVRRPSGEVTLDPDEQVQAVVRVIFRKFEELGTLNAVLQYLVKHQIQLGIRAHEKINKGELQWHRPSRMTLQNLLKHPMYAGAYTYGRRQVDPRRKKPGRPSTGRLVSAPEEWHVLLKNRLPAYISWEQYERNIARLKSNQSKAEELGAVRRGSSLLSGLLVCGKCGCRMTVSYGGHHHSPTYLCSRQQVDYGGEICQSMAGKVLETFVSQRALEALAPASLELSLEACKNMEQERDQLSALWRQRLERATYEVERAARQYRLVEPENRLVARQLERDWEEKLAEQRKLEEESRRFELQKPRILSELEREAIHRLAADIPALWEASSTTNADRKEILRQVIERVVVTPKGNSERVSLMIHWMGGSQTQEELVKPVAKLEQLSYYPALCDRIRTLIAKGLSVAEMTDELNAEGYRPPKRREKFGRQGIQDLMRQLGLSTPRWQVHHSVPLEQDEWRLLELARKIPMPAVTLYNWIRRGWVKAHQQQQSPRLWIVWADEAELERLRERHQRSRGFYTRQHWVEHSKANEKLPLKVFQKNTIN